MELKNLYIFRAIVKEGGFTQAARKLNYTQSTITFHVGQLERELKVRLFEKIGRRMILTKAGEQLVPYVEDVFQALGKMEGFQNEVSHYTGRLRIGAPESLLCFSLPPFLKVFQQKAPKTSLLLTSMNSQSVIEALKEDKIDIGVLYTEKHEDEDHIIFEPVGRHRLIMAASRRMKKEIERARGSRGKDIGVTRIVQPQRGSLRKKFDEYCRQRGIPEGNTIELRSTQTIINLVKNDMGLCFLPNFVLQEELDKGVLEEIAVPGEPICISSAVAYYKNKWISLAMELFIYMMKNKE